MDEEPTPFDSPLNWDEEMKIHNATKRTTQTKVGRMFKFFTPFELTQAEALKVQLELGYHPSGYGFYSFMSSKIATTWMCGDSCD